MIAPYLVAPQPPAIVSARPAPQTTSTEYYDSYRSGSSDNVDVKTRPGLFMMGGAADSKEGFSWMIDHAGQGDILILRASGADGYNDFVQDLAPVNSVESIVLKDRGASSDPYVLQRVKEADAIFFAGGDQSKYFAIMENSPLADSINEKSRSIPLGGTSAGLAILGEMAYSARGQHSVEYRDALKNPQSPDITLEPSFLHNPNLKGALTDTHFSQRDRLGRLIPFMQNLSQAGKPVKGVGVDEATAILLESDGSGRVVGQNKAVFVTGPSAEGIFQVQEVPAGNRVDVNNWGDSSGTFPRQSYRIQNSQLQTLDGQVLLPRADSAKAAL